MLTKPVANFGHCRNGRSPALLWTRLTFGVPWGIAENRTKRRLRTRSPEVLPGPTRPTTPAPGRHRMAANHHLEANPRKSNGSSRRQLEVERLGSETERFDSRKRAQAVSSPRMETRTNGAVSNQPTQSPLSATRIKFECCWRFAARSLVHGPWKCRNLRGSQTACPVFSAGE